MVSMDYSKHAVERFVERFPDHLEAGVAPKVSMHRAFQGASLERGFMNDSRRIIWMLEKYGDFNFDYYLNGKMVFITREGICITVINRDDSGMQVVFGPSVQPRFRKKRIANA